MKQFLKTGHDRDSERERKLAFSKQDRQRRETQKRASTEKRQSGRQKDSVVFKMPMLANKPAILYTIESMFLAVAYPQIIKQEINQ